MLIRNDMGMLFTHLDELFSVRLPGKKRHRIGTQQHKRMRVATKFLPKRLQVILRRLITLLPQQGYHLSENVYAFLSFACPLDYTANNLYKTLWIWCPVHKELCKRLCSIQRNIFLL